MSKYIIPIFAIMFVISCKNDTETRLAPEIVNAAKVYRDQPTAENANSALEKISTALKANKEDKATVKDLAEEALDIATQSKLTAKQISFLLLLVKEYPNDSQAAQRLLELGNIMKNINKAKAANVLYSGLIHRFPDSDQAELANKSISPEAKDIDAYLTAAGEEVFADPDKYGINRRAGQSYVDACEAYALAYPDSPMAPEYLYKGTEVSRTLRTFTKSLTMYDWILDKYPDYEKAPTAMFLKGFIIENELKNADLARQVYSDFLKTYPDHQLKDDVQFLLDNLGKSDEEIMKMIEENKKKQVQ